VKWTKITMNAFGIFNFYSKNDRAFRVVDKALRTF
jgi:hypothetical protein